MFSLLPALLAGKCKISFTYYNNEAIPEDKYATNYLGFRVVSKGCSDIKVYKDGANIESKAGYNEIGEYKVTSGSVEKMINIKELANSQIKNVHITFHMATFSTIQGIQQLIKAVKTTPKPDEIMLYYARGSTLVKEQVIKNLGTQNVFTYAKVGEMKKKIIKLYKENPNIFITFYCEDIRCHYITLFFVNQGIPDDRYQIILNSDGSAQYSIFYDNNDDKIWHNNQKEYQRALDRAKIGKMSDPGDIGHINYMFFYATLQNVKLIPPSMKYFQTNNPEVKKTIDAMNTELLDPIKDLKKMPEDQQKMYFEMTGVDVDYWKNEYFPKLPMMIIGTHARDQGNYFRNLDEWKFYLFSLLSLYGNNYSICFKPHPAAGLSRRFRNMMKEGNIKIIETQVPSEAIIAALDDVKVGGYFSSVFLTTTPEFIFAESPSYVIPFYQPTIRDSNCKYVMSRSQLCWNFGILCNYIGLYIAAIVPTVVLGIAIAVLVIFLVKKPKKNNAIKQPLLQTN